MVDVRDNHHALPRERRYFISKETTFGTRIQPVGADAVRILAGVTGSPVPARVERVDNRQTRSIESRITGSTPPIEWSAEGYLIPSGAAGTAPDIIDVLTSALGPNTNVPATSDTINPSDMQQELGSLTITDELSEILMESLAGGWVEEFTLSGTGGDPVMWSASGLAASSVLTARSEVVTVVTDTVTPLANEARKVEVGSRVKFVEPSDGKTVIDDNTSAGFVVIARDLGANTFQLNANPTGVNAGDICVPFVPTEVTTGNPAPGIVGSATIGGVTVRLQSWEVTIKNNIQPHADEAFQSNTTGYHEDNRQVTGQMTLRARSDQIDFLSQRKQFAGLATVITVGTTAGEILTITMPTAELDFTNVDKAQPESAIITLPFQALGTGNEINLAFT